LKGGGVAGVLKRATWFLIFIFIKISKSDEREWEKLEGRIRVIDTRFSESTYT
jgi:hypothetical protein